jgi:hypothetical protein
MQSTRPAPKKAPSRTLQQDILFNFLCVEQGKEEGTSLPVRANGRNQTIRASVSEFRVGGVLMAGFLLE